MPGFYLVDDDKSGRPRWHLRGPRNASGDPVDPRVFTNGERVSDPGPLHIELRRRGPPLDFTLADFAMPVVSARLGSHLAELVPDSIQRIPVAVAGTTAPYEILNVVSVVECLDESRTGITRWNVADGRLDKVGQYQIVVNEVIDPRRAGNAQLFRLRNWVVDLVAGETVHAALSARPRTSACDSSRLAFQIDSRAV